ncbi:MAG: family oxidoreductase, partial [Rhizobium sp.]|nr:family oxidoreductase [Rhizobium sp.]
IAPGALVTRMMDQLLEAGPEKVGQKFYDRMKKLASEGGTPLDIGGALCVFLGSAESDGITGKLIAAQWDRWEDWPKHLEELNASDVYTLRRITGRDRNKEWGDR